MRVVWLCAISNFIEFMPIFFTSYTIVDFTAKKIYFAVTVFGINIIGGYATVGGLKIYVHLSEKKVFIANIGDDIKLRKKFIKISHIDVYNEKSLMQTGKENIGGIYAAAVWWAIVNGFCPKINSRKDFMKMNNDIAILNGEDFSFYLKVACVTNLFSLGMLVFTNILEKVRYNGRRKQSGKSY